MAIIPPRLSVVTQMRLEAKHVAPLMRVFSDASKQVGRDLDKLDSGGNPLTKMQMELQKETLNNILERSFEGMEGEIRRGMREAAIAASQIASRYENQLLGMGLTKAEMQRIAKAEALRTANNLNAAMQRMFGSSRVPLAEQIYNTKQIASGWIDSRINLALASGWDARRFAREMAGSFDPRVRGGVSYAANRLARTEINNAYHAAAADRYMKSPIVQSVDWSLSSSHPEEDVCNDLAANSPYPKNGVPAKPHPHCYCYITPRLPTEEEFLDMLFNGDFGDEPWAQDDLDWRPSMSAAEAERWARGSALPGEFMHGTTKAGARGIANEGFDVGREQYGRAHGNGVYLTENQATADMYSSGGVVKVRVNVTNPVDLNDIFIDPDYFDASDWVEENFPNMDPKQQAAEAINEYARRKGYDAIVKRKWDGTIDELIVPDPKNIVVIGS